MNCDNDKCIKSEEEKRYKLYIQDCEKYLKKHDQEWGKFCNYPELHPRYKKEWNRFYIHRSKKLLQMGKDAKNYDYLSEWADIWLRKYKKYKNKELKKMKFKLLLRHGYSRSPNPVGNEHKVINWRSIINGDKSTRRSCAPVNSDVIKIKPESTTNRYGIGDTVVFNQEASSFQKSTNEKDEVDVNKNVPDSMKLHSPVTTASMNCINDASNKNLPESSLTNSLPGSSFSSGNLYSNKNTCDSTIDDISRKTIELALNEVVSQCYRCINQLHTVLDLLGPFRAVVVQMKKEIVHMEDEKSGSSLEMFSDDRIVEIFGDIKVKLLEDLKSEKLSKDKSLILEKVVKSLFEMINALKNVKTYREYSEVK